MVEKVHGLVPEAGNWVEGELKFAVSDAIDDSVAEAYALDAAVKALQAIGTIVMLEIVGAGTNAAVLHVALGYAGGDLPAGWTEGSFRVA